MVKLKQCKHQVSVNYYRKTGLCMRVLAGTCSSELSTAKTRGLGYQGLVEGPFRPVKSPHTTRHSY